MTRPSRSSGGRWHWRLERPLRYEPRLCGSSDVENATNHARAGEQRRSARSDASPRFYALAQTGTELKQLGTVGRGHPFTWSGYDKDTVALGQQVLSEGIDKPFVSRDQPDKASDQVVQQLAVMRASGQEGTGGDHPTACDAQPQLEAIVVQLLSGTVAIIGKGLEAAVAATAGVATHRQGQRINDLYRVSSLATDLGQPLLNNSFDLPEVSGLTNKQCPVPQLWEEVGIVGAKVCKEVLIGGQLKYRRRSPVSALLGPASFAMS